MSRNDFREILHDFKGSNNSHNKRKGEVLEVDQLESWALSSLSPKFITRKRPRTITFPEEVDSSEQDCLTPGTDVHPNNLSVSPEAVDTAFEFFIENNFASQNSFEDRLSNSQHNRTRNRFRNNFDLFVNASQLPSPSKPPSPTQYEPSFNINSRVSLWQGDITRLALDAIVNATGHDILRGAGVTQSIISAGGPGLISECRSIGGCRPGKVRLTGGHGLPARHVIHTAGPSCELPGILKACYRNCLEAAASHNPPLLTVAFPCIATGVGRYPKVSAAHIALSTVAAWLRAHPASGIRRVVFCTYMASDHKIYSRLLPTYFPIAIPQFPAYSLQ